jgi:hypothetical protein
MSPKNRAKACMPSKRRLFETIERLNEVTEMLRASRINKAWGLTHIDLLLQDSMQKSILNIQLAQ